LTAFLKSTEGSLNSTLREVEDTMKSFREVTDNISSVTQDAKDFSSSLVGLADDVKSVGDSIHNLTSRTSRNVSGIRAGISAALEIILENLITRKGGKSA
jgi:ABC-type transporter Mla subunit MlaD